MSTIYERESLAPPTSARGRNAAEREGERERGGGGGGGARRRGASMMIYLKLISHLSARVINDRRQRQDLSSRTSLGGSAVGERISRCVRVAVSRSFACPPV